MIALFIIFTFSHLAEAFIQSDFNQGSVRQGHVDAAMQSTTRIESSDI